MPETILIVEDELSLQETLAYNLKKEGYTVETVGDGRAALDGESKFSTLSAGRWREALGGSKY